MCVVALAGAPAGCGQASVQPTHDAAVFQTDREAYTPVRTRWGFEVVILFTYSNTTGDSLYIINCNRILPITLEKRDGDEWRTPVVSAYPACLSEPMVIAPRSQLVDSVRVLAGTAETPDTMIAGTYRLVWHGLVRDYHMNRAGAADSIPSARRVSNTFRLRAPSSAP
jgi:hypothetical protein